MTRRSPTAGHNIRDQFIISQALVIAIRELNSVPEPHTELSNIADMERLRDTHYPLFKTVDQLQKQLAVNNNSGDSQ